MKKENILTYNDVEAAEYHREQADECSRVITKLRDFVF